MLPLFLMTAWLAVAILIGGILLVAFKRRPERPGWTAAPGQVATAPAGAPGAGQPAPRVGVWNAEVLGNGGFGLLGRSYGTLRLEAGVLSYVPDSSTVPAWSVPCHELAARRGSLFELNAAVRLVGPMGQVRCNVSTEHINRFSANTAKDLRQRTCARQFVHLLHAHGAGVAP